MTPVSESDENIKLGVLSLVGVTTFESKFSVAKAILEINNTIDDVINNNFIIAIFFWNFFITKNYFLKGVNYKIVIKKNIQISSI